MARVIMLLIVAAWVCYVAVMALPTCTDVSSNLSPCLSFVTSTAPTPSSACCDGVKKISGMAATKADRQAICKCIKRQASLVPNLNSTRISELPATCKVQVPVPIGPNIDCEKIN